ncbi:hypothetical protein JMJ35_000097 [Cladonia borealis]|uniref:Heterokaryon incompatibility domain-containing protein n=1 Tax=Cladonia borealis TaxID=184061 RepID=A0AA39V5I5_9LECA|nr:hypothetical protein JMJ35_000097 [Cladonia borealis]
MDPEDAGHDPKPLLNTVVGDANDDESSGPPKASSTAQPGPELHIKNGPDVFDGIEGQIALDSFTQWLRPWEPPVEGDGAQLEHLGAVDQLVDLEDHYGSLSNTNKLHLEPGAAQVHNREISNGDQQSVAVSSTATNVPGLEPITLQRASTGYIEPEEIFEYDDLPTDGQHFRLLGRGPPDEHGKISSLTLHTFDINDAPPFYAISYVWHDQQLEVPMTCNHKKLMITDSLGSALEKLVPWSCGTYLWADGICINQGNIAERNHQVSLMGSIYGRASKVLAHLGDSGPTEDDSSDWSPSKAPGVGVTANPKAKSRVGNYNGPGEAPEAKTRLVKKGQRTLGIDKCERDCGWQSRVTKAVNSWRQRRWQ